MKMGQITFREVRKSEIGKLNEHGSQGRFWGFEVWCVMNYEVKDPR